MRYLKLYCNKKKNLLEQCLKCLNFRYNNYKNELFSKCDCTPPYSGENTISARSDLNPANGKYPFDALGHRDHGATDMKMTSSDMAKHMEFIAISGP